MDHGHHPIEAADLVAATLAAATDHARAHGVRLGGDGPTRAPHEAAPATGTRTEVTRAVGAEDTAAAVGHPDPEIDVLSSPTIALWFELAASELMPTPGAGLRHVGVGIVVHHLDTAAVGDEVAVSAEVTAVDGRAVRFACDAVVDGRLVATGDHHRLVLDAPD